MKVLKFLLLLFSFSYSFGQNSLHIKDLNAGPGEVTKIIISLENQNDVSGLQFTLKLPKELIVKEKEALFIQRNTNHVIYPKNKGNGKFFYPPIVCFGDVLWDILPISSVPGGAPMNVTYHLNKLKKNPALIPRAGEDERGMRWKDIFKAHNVGTT